MFTPMLASDQINQVTIMPATRKPLIVWLILLTIPLAGLAYYPFLPAQMDGMVGTKYGGIDVQSKDETVLLGVCLGALLWLVLRLLTWIAGRFSERLASWCWELNGILLICVLYAEVSLYEDNRVQAHTLWPHLAFAVIGTIYLTPKVCHVLFRRRSNAKPH